MTLKYLAIILLGYISVFLLIGYILSLSYKVKKKTKVVISVVFFLTLTINTAGILNWYYTDINIAKVEEEIDKAAVKVNEKSKYVNEYMMYQSYKSMEVSSLGSEEAYLEEIANEGMTEPEYAKKVLTEILKEQHIKNAEEVATKAIDENWNYVK